MPPSLSPASPGPSLLQAPALFQNPAALLSLLLLGRLKERIVLPAPRVTTSNEGEAALLRAVTIPGISASLLFDTSLFSWRGSVCQSKPVQGEKRIPVQTPATVQLLSQQPANKAEHILHGLTSKLKIFSDKIPGMISFVLV